jgi:hypothetical protein
MVIFIPIFIPIEPTDVLKRIKTPTKLLYRSVVAIETWFDEKSHESNVFPISVVKYKTWSPNLKYLHDRPYWALG